MGRKQGNKKRVCSHKGRFEYSCVLLRFGNTLRCPSLRRMHTYWNLPYNLRSRYNIPPPFSGATWMDVRCPHID
jgi:hypothetical protein